MANLPCERVPELVFWCWDTADGPQKRWTFTIAAHGMGIPEAVEWSADKQYIPLNPPGRRGITPPDKKTIASYLLARLMAAGEEEPS